MPRQWQLHEAKKRFSEVVRRARSEGPQIVIRRGRPAVVVLSYEEHEKLVQSRSSLVDFFRNSPLRGVGLDLERVKEIASLRSQ